MREIIFSCQRFIALLTLSGLMAGCVSLKPPATVAPHYYKPWPQRQAELMRLSRWTIDGAFSIQYAGQTQLANYVWQQQNPQNYVLTLSGPLSIGAAQIVGQPGVITLTKADGKSFKAKTPEELMRANLGWQLPLHNLYYWVRGLPAPGSSANIQIDTKNYLLALQQQGWQINYLRFDTIEGVELPVMMTLTNKQLHAKIVVKHWQIGH